MMVKHNQIFIALTLALSLLISSAYAATKTLVYELKHQVPSQLMPALEGFSQRGATISHFQNALVISADQALLQEIQSVLAHLDKPPKMLLISVRQNNTQSGHEQNISYEGSLKRRHLHLEQYSTHDRDSQNHQVSVLEGNIGYIETGQEFPVAYFQQHNAYDSSLSIDYKKTATGFYAKAHVQGDMATVHASPYKEVLSRHHGGTVDTSAIETIVRAPLNQWTSLGGSFQSATSTQRGTTYSTKPRDTHITHIQIKVEELP